MDKSGSLGLLAQQLRAGKCVFSAWCGIGEPILAELLVRDGFDTAVLDMQHGAYDYARAHLGISHVSLAGKSAIVRIPVGDFAEVSRLLDAGAAGIIAPMINSVEDARTFAAFAKYPPMGERSWGPSRALTISGMNAGDYFHTANDFTRAIAMIETREALAALDDILAVPGIDGIFIGPSDLSIALTNGRTVDPMASEVLSALDHIVARAKAHNKFAGIFTFSGTVARDMAARGFSLCSISNDTALLRKASALELAAARA